MIFKPLLSNERINDLRNTIVAAAAPLSFSTHLLPIAGKMHEPGAGLVGGCLSLYKHSLTPRTGSEIFFFLFTTLGALRRYVSDLSMLLVVQ